MSAGRRVFSSLTFFCYSNKKYGRISFSQINPQEENIYVCVFEYFVYVCVCVCVRVIVGDKTTTTTICCICCVLFFCSLRVCSQNPRPLQIPCEKILFSFTRGQISNKNLFFFPGKQQKSRFVKGFLPVNKTFISQKVSEKFKLVSTVFIYFC